MKLKITYLSQAIKENIHKLFVEYEDDDFQHEISGILEDMDYLNEYDYNMDERITLLRDHFYRGLGAIDDRNLYKNIIIKAYNKQEEQNEVNLKCYFHKDKTATLYENNILIARSYYKTIINNLQKYKDDNYSVSYYYDEGLDYNICD